MNSIERILYPEQEQQEQAQVTQHQQAVEAVRQCAEFFMLELADDAVERILLKTGEKAWIDDGGKH